MLLGDRVAQLMKTVGADKLAKMYEEIGGRPCGCAGRQKALNDWHQKALLWLNKNKDG